MTQIKTLDLITAAVTAYRINGGSVIRNGVTSNRKIMHSVLIGDIASTEADRAQAEDIVSYLVQRHTFATLVGKDLNEFSMRCVGYINNDTIHKNHFGIMAWAPKLHSDLLKLDQQKHEFTVLSYGSKYLGSPKATVELNFTAISVRYNKPFLAWRYTGHDNQGNLVGFLKSRKLSRTDNVQLSATIKSTEVSSHTGGKTTILYHVKEIKSNPVYNAL